MRNLHSIEPEEIMAYLDGELPVERAAAAAEHMGSCEECQKLAGDLRGLSRRLAAWEMEEASIHLKMPEPAVPRRRRWVRWTGWGAGLAAACVLLFMATAPRVPRDLGDASGGRFQSFLTALAPQGVDLAKARAPKEEPFGSQIIRTVEIALTTSQFDQSRAAMDTILKRHAGYVGRISQTASPASGRTLDALLRIPSAQLDQALAEVRALGHIDSESQGGEDVTRQVVDLDARIVNSQTTEQRLRDLIRQSTGKITDVLEVEKELTRVREEIERMQAERKSLGDRVSFSQLNVRITEEYKAHLSPASPAGQLRNAAVEGWRNVTGGVVGLAEFLLAYGPSLVLWAALLFFPARYLWRRFRP